MKKTYQKPTMQVVELQHHAPLLINSNDYPIGYMPGQPGLGSDDMNKLA